MIATKPMFLSRISAITATATKASRVSTWSIRTRSSSSSCFAASSSAASSGSIRALSSFRPPSRTKRIAAITVFTIRLAKKMVSSLVGRPASSITWLVMVP